MITWSATGRDAETEETEMEYVKVMQKILTSGLPAKKQLRLMEALMELRAAVRGLPAAEKTGKEA